MKLFFDAIREHAQATPHSEACGLLLAGYGATTAPLAYQTANLCVDPDSFQIPLAEIVHARNEGRLLGYYHSHWRGPAIFSDEDRRSAEHSGLPIWVYSLPDNAFNLYKPARLRNSLEGRSFVLGLNDCVQIVADWLLLQRNLLLPYWERNWAHLRSGSALWTDLYGAVGYKPLPQTAWAHLCIGDLLTFSVGTAGTNAPNHTGVLIGTGIFLHQMFGRPSAVVSLADWRPQLVGVYRI